MTKKEFWDKYYDRKFDLLLPETDNAIQYDFDIENEAKHASYANDFELLYFLWKAGAKGETPFIEDVFKRYHNGESYIILEQEKIEKEKKKRAKAAADLTSLKSVEEFPVGKINLFIEDIDECYLSVNILPYLFEEYVVEPDGLSFGPFPLKKKLWKNQKIEFKPRQFDESIYLFHAHNPVDLKSLQLKKVNRLESLMTIEILFRFSFEGNGEDQTLILKKTINTRN